MEAHGEGGNEVNFIENLLYWLRKTITPAPVRTLDRGDLVEPEDIERALGERPAEDGRVFRLYDRRCGRTAAQAFQLGGNPTIARNSPIKLVD